MAASELSASDPDLLTRLVCSLTRPGGRREGRGMGRGRGGGGGGGRGKESSTLQKEGSE